MDELWNNIIKNLQALILHDQTDADEAEILAGYAKELTDLWEANMDRRLDRITDSRILKHLRDKNPDPCTLDQKGLSEFIAWATEDEPIEV